ncbi:Regulator of microtubule dynamics protein 2 [Schistosoma japonicum]|nr:Regulator of microtubule dynamics protein 2 [Schistosoma japonicum]
MAKVLAFFNLSILSSFYSEPIDMANSQNCGLSKVATVGTVFGTGLFSYGRLDKRTFLSALFGAALGFGLGILSCGLLNSLLLLLKRDKPSEQLRHMADQLACVKAELSELRNEAFYAKTNSLNSKNNDEIQPIFLVDDDYDLDGDYEKYFDVETVGDDVNSPLSTRFPSEVLSSTNSFQSVCSNDSAYCTMTAQVPTDVLEELDKLTDYALGECSSSELQIHSHEDYVNPAIHAYARCLVYMCKYRYRPEFLWRLARATYAASEAALPDEENVQQKDDVLHGLNDIAYKVQTRRQFIESGIKHARRALSLIQRAHTSDLVNDPIKRAPVYKWLAVLIGVYSSYLSAQQRIQYGYEFKASYFAELIDTAIKLDDSDALSYYLQGRWCYEVYNLSWLERQIASRLFASPPTSTIKEAEIAFEKAEKLRPNHYAALYLYRAKCSISHSDYVTALYNLNKARGLFAQQRNPLPHTDTGSIQQQVDQLYEKYSGYL